MDLLTTDEIVDAIDSLILTLNEDENQFYVAIDLAHQLREELLQVLSGDE
jgi:exonuclease VII small subunit